MSWLLFLAIALLLFWVTAEALGWVIGIGLNLFWMAAVVLIAIWIVQKI